MRKNLTKLLQDGDLQPKERVLLLIKNIVSEETTGKKILSKAEEQALSENWTPKDNNEVAEYNKYNGAWRFVSFMGMDGQTYYLRSLNNFYRIRMILNFFNFYPITHRAERGIKKLKEIKKVSGKEAIEIIAKTKDKHLKGGCDFDYSIYQLAFDLLSDEDKKTMIELCEEVEYDHQWLDNEVELAELIKAKDFKGIAERVANKSYNSYAKEYQFWGYYACIPVEEVAKRWADKNKSFIEDYTKDFDFMAHFEEHTPENLTKAIKSVAKDKNISEDEVKSNVIFEKKRIDILQLQDYAKANKTTIESILKEVCLEWLDNGLLKEYQPLATSNYKELLNRWLASRKTAQDKLNRHIKDGEIKIEGELLTGDSLYNCDLDYKFIKEFKKRVDNYDPLTDGEILIASDKSIGYFNMSLGLIKYGTITVLEEEKDGDKILVDFTDEWDKNRGDIKRVRDEGLNYYTSLLQINNILEELSKIYEIDISYTIKGYIKELEAQINEYNEFLNRALINNSDKKTKELKDQSLYIDLDEVRARPVVDDNLARYYKEFKDLLGSEYKGQPPITNL